MLLVDLRFVANDTFLFIFFSVKRKIWRGISQNFFSFVAQRNLWHATCLPVFEH